jgi:hypothetical protein
VPQVLEDALHHARILDQRDHPHRPLAPGAFERIGFENTTRVIGEKSLTGS